MLARNLNLHVGESRIGFKRWHGSFSVGDRREEADNSFNLAQAFDQAIVNTF